MFASLQVELEVGQSSGTLTYNSIVCGAFFRGGEGVAVSQPLMVNVV